MDALGNLGLTTPLSLVPVSWRPSEGTLRGSQKVPGYCRRCTAVGGAIGTRMGSGKDGKKNRAEIGTKRNMVMGARREQGTMGEIAMSRTRARTGQAGRNSHPNQCTALSVCRTALGAQQPSRSARCLLHEAHTAAGTLRASPDTRHSLRVAAARLSAPASQLRCRPLTAPRTAPGAASRTAPHRPVPCAADGAWRARAAGLGGCCCPYASARRRRSARGRRTGPAVRRRRRRGRRG